MNNPLLKFLHSIRYSILWRILGIILLLQLGALSLMLYNNNTVIDRLLSEEAERRARSLAPLLNVTFRDKVFSQDMAKLEEDLAYLREAHYDLRYIIIFNEWDDVLFSVGQIQPDNNLPIGSAMLREVGNEYVYDSISPLVYNERRIGQVQIGISLQALSESERYAFKQTLLLGGVEVVVSLVLIVLVGLALTRQLRDFVTSAKAVSRGSYDIKLDGQRRDELGELAGCFNEMVEAIEERTETLRSSENRFRTITEMSSVALYLTDAEGNLLYANPLWCKHAGLSPEQAAGQGWLQGIHAADRIPIANTWRTTMRQYGHWRQEYRFYNTATEQLTWVMGIAEPLYDSNQELQGYLGVNVDISERKHAEANLERWRQVFEHAGWGIAVSKPNADNIPQIDLLNPRYAAMHGYSVDELLGQPVSMLYPPDLAQNIADYVQQVSTSGYLNTETWHLRRDNSRFPVQLDMSVVYTDDQRVDYFIVNLQDISRQKQAEEALKTLYEELEEKVAERTRELHQANLHLQKLAQMKDEFLASVSHELRSPLNAILLNAEILNEQLHAQLTAKQLKFLNRIDESGRHLLSLINDILDLAKLESGKTTLELSMVSISGICDICASLIKESALRKQLKFNLRYDKKVGLIEADGRRLKQILINLLSNAVKFTPEGGTISLEYEGNEAAQQVIFRVTDTGIGIAPDMATKLFQPFVQLDSRLSREYQGTGLGLSLVKSLADLHGGSVSLESTPNQGSCFTVILPWKTQPHSDATAETLHDATLPTAITHQQSVLVVDDNAENLDSICAYLEIKGFEAIPVKSGAAALKFLANATVGVILMDIQMPGMDGYEAITRIRHDLQQTRIPIIATTALAMVGDKERCLSAGANAYLSKPLVLSELLTTIKTLTHT